jgi:hypothetical protein
MASQRPTVTGGASVGISVVGITPTQFRESLMAAARYPVPRTRPLRRGLSFIEFVLAVSVMGGLAFVTVRMQKMADAESHAQSAKPSAVATAKVP